MKLDGVPLDGNGIPSARTFAASSLRFSLAPFLRYSSPVDWRYAFVFLFCTSSFLSVSISSDKELDLSWPTEYEILFLFGDNNRPLFSSCISGICRAGCDAFTCSGSPMTSVELGSHFSVDSCAASTSSFVLRWEHLCCTEDLDRLNRYLSDWLPFLRIGRVCFVVVLSLRLPRRGRDVGSCCIVTWLVISLVESWWNFCKSLPEFEYGWECTTAWRYLLFFFDIHADVSAYHCSLNWISFQETDFEVVDCWGAVKAWLRSNRLKLRNFGHWNEDLPSQAFGANVTVDPRNEYC